MSVALSPAAPIRLMSQEALINAGTVYGMIILANDLAIQGHEAEALRGLANLARVLPAELKAVQQIIAAQQQAAEAVNLTQRTLAPFFPRVPAEHPNAANDQSPSPQQPGPDVA